MARKGGGSGGGGGGSQLAQLKSRLHNEGITDRRQMKASAKKRKRGQASNEKEEEQSRREKLSKIASLTQFNPFEEKVTKPKAAAVGQRIRGATGRPGAARQGGLQERTARLLPEWINRNKSGSFVDRRFGESDGAGSMSVEDKMLERFTRERQKKASKASMFNLDDMEEEGLTHYGRSLNDLDQYDDIHLSDEEMDEDRMAHFGGFGDDDTKRDENQEDEEERTKTKAEVMKEVVAKSKAHKLERQQVKQADEDLRQQLDDDFGDLRSLLFAPGAMPEPVKEEEKERDVQLSDKKAKETAYDTAVRELAFERRAKPQDRLKTAEEKAQELAEKLQKAESDRLRRMRGEDLEDADGRRRTAGGDDLEDDFELDGMTSADVYGLGQGLQAQGAEESREDTSKIIEDDAEVEESGDDDGGDDGGDDGDDDDEDDEEESEDDFGDLAGADTADQQGEDVEEEAEAGKPLESIVAARAAAPSKSSAQPAPALPFTFPCPVDLGELLDILAKNKVETPDVPVVIKRIRALHHSSLAEENKFKLQALTGVLLDYLLHLSMRTTSSSKHESLNTINELVPQLFTLSKAYPETSAEHFVGKLAVMQRNLTRGLSQGPLEKRSKTWPGLAECTLLKVCGKIWPTSDRTHAVTTPLSLLIGQYLASCRIRSVVDVAVGLYLVSLTTDQQRQSKRLMPEALNFLHNAIAMLAPSASYKELKRINAQFGIPCPDINQPQTKRVRLDVSGIDHDRSSGDSIDFLSLLLTEEGDGNEDVKAQLLHASFLLLDEMARLYTGSAAFVELFQPFEMLLVDVLRPVQDASIAWLEDAKRQTQERVTRMVMNAQRQRRALRLQAHRAVPLASHVPKFDQGFDPTRKGGRTFDPDAERAEVAKLRALAKKERKGAMRELRRDNEFLAEARRQEREQEEQRYAKSIDKIMGSLSAERGEEKSYLREKQRIKRRAGGKK